MTIAWEQEMLRARTSWLGSFLIIFGCGHSEDPAGHWIIEQEVGPFVLSAPTSVNSSFSVENPSATETMNLVPKHRSCGCFDFRLPSSQVPPSGRIDVPVSAALGAETKTAVQFLRFDTGLRQKPTLELRLRIRRFATLEFVPKDPTPVVFVNADNVRIPFEVITHELIENGGAPWIFKSPDPLNHLSVDRTLETQKEGVRAIRNWCTLEIGGVTTRRKPRGTAMVVATRGQAKTIREFHWQREQVVLVEPSELFMQIGPSGEAIREIRLSAEKEFSITKVTADDRRLAVAHNAGQRARNHAITLACKSVKNLRVASPVVLVETDHPLQPVIEIPVHILNWAGVKHAESTWIVSPNKTREQRREKILLEPNFLPKRKKELFEGALIWKDAERSPQQRAGERKVECP